jgi:hypothetical protein
MLRAVRPLVWLLIVGATVALAAGVARAEPSPRRDPLDERGGLRAYADLLLEAGGRAGVESGPMVVAGAGLGLEWGGGYLGPDSDRRGYWILLARGRAGSDLTGGTISFVDLRLVRRIAAERRALSFELGPAASLTPEKGGGGGLAIAWGSGGAAGVSLRFDSTVIYSRGLCAVFSLGLQLGVAGYRD